MLIVYYKVSPDAEYEFMNVNTNEEQIENHLCISTLHFPCNNILILLINLQKHRRIPLQNLRLNHKIHKKRSRLSLARIRADPMVTTRCLVPGTATFNHLHRLIIHLVQERAVDYIGGDGRTSVTVRRGRAIRGVFDQHANGGLSWTIGQFILVGDGGFCQRASSGIF